MKRIVFLILIAFAVNSCSLNDEPDRAFVLLPIEEVIVPDTFTVGNISTFKLKYRRPTQCDIFDGFYYDIDEMTRTVAIQAVKLNQPNCPNDSESMYEVPLEFKPTVTGVYTFKFWLGVDQDGIDQYSIFDVEVQ
jgi:hypothetical protein